MNLILCLAATTTLVSLCQAARIPRGIDGFPHFHAVHHGYGATSYQNVQIENYGSVPVPTEDHQHYQHHSQEEPFIIHVIQETNQDEPDHETEVIHSAPVVEEHQHLQRFIIIEKDDHEYPHPDGNIENQLHYVTLEQVPHYNNEIQHSILDDLPDYSVYHSTYGEYISEL